MITTKRRNIYLPIEVIEELFIRMPVKSITKFKCVCKEWNIIISGHRFRSLYQSQHRHACRSGYFYYSNIPLWALSSSTTDEYISRFAQAKVVNICNIGKEDLALCHDLQKLGYVIGTSNGLLLLSKNNTSYHVYDLLTKKAAKLPEPHTKYSYASTGLICKEREQDCLTNINNTSSYHYKIVRAVQSKKTMVCELETYSSETRIWQKSLMTATSKFCLDTKCMPKVIGGVLHWKNDVGNLIAYNPEDPSGRAISIDVPVLKDYVRAKITGYGDGLVMCIRNSSNDIDMWFLGMSYLDEDKVDRSRWTFFRKVCFDEPGRLGNSLPAGPIRRLFAIDFDPRDSNVIFLQMNNKFISYDLNEKRIVFIRSLGEGDKLFSPDSYFFFEWPLWPRL